MSGIVDIRDLQGYERAGLELKTHLDNALGRVDYPYFVSEILGYHHIANDKDNPGNFEQFNDPRVRWHLEEIGGFIKDWMLTRHQQTSFRKIMDVRPRGTCKSATATIPLPIWTHINNSEMASGVIGAKYDDMAADFAGATKLTLEGNDKFSRLTDLYGNFRGADKWTKTKMVTSKRENIGRKDPTYGGYSVGKGATSAHFDLLILDDIVTEERMQEDDNWLDKAWNQYSLVPYILNRNGLLYMIMTRYHDDDPCGRIVREEIEPAVREAYNGDLPDDWDYDEGWIKYAKLANWDVRYDAVYEDYDSTTKTGKVVYPVCWSDEKIKASRLSENGEFKFNFHLMNRPKANEAAPLKAKDIQKLYFTDIEDIPAQAWNCVDLHCDFSFKDIENYEKQRGDYSVAHAVASWQGHVWRFDGLRCKLMQDDFGEELMALVNTIKHTYDARVRFITYDQSATQGQGDKSTDYWIQGLFAKTKLMPAIPKPIRRNLGGNTKKIARVLSTVWAWQEGYVHLLKDAPHTKPLVYQMLNLGHTSFDDDRDAFANAFHDGIYQAGPLGHVDADDDFDWTPALRVVGGDDWEDDEEWL